MVIENLDHVRWMDIMSVQPSSSKEGRVVVPRPGHADYAGSVKYGFDDIRNVIERASARETAMRVACCTLARLLLEECGVSIGSHVVGIGPVSVDGSPARRNALELVLRRLRDGAPLTKRADGSSVRMLDARSTAAAIAAIKGAGKRGDTLGGVFEVRVFGLPIGLGSYVHYDRKLDGLLAQALMSVHAIKGVEVGRGFENASLPGSKVHDAFVVKKRIPQRRTNNAGGLEGGVTNGEVVVLRAAMKPISTLARPLSSVNIRTRQASPGRYERSDVCAVPAASVIGEAVVAPVLANALLEKFGGDSLQELRKRIRTR